MISLKDYAKKHNVSYEAVRKQVVRFKDEIGDHVKKVDRIQYLDDTAEKFLDERRSRNPIIIEQVNKDLQIKTLEENIKMLLSEKAALETEIKELYKEQARQAKEVAAAEQNQKLLIDTQRNLEESQKRIAEAENLIKETEKKTAEKIKEIEEKAAEDISKAEKQKFDAEQKVLQRDAEIDDLNIKLQEEKDRPLTFWERVTGKKRKEQHGGELQ